MIVALVRSHKRMSSPSLETVLAAHDEIILYGTETGLQHAEHLIFN
jgi:K+/H+ antiporter YhaU regulatory subunit KhtT